MTSETECHNDQKDSIRWVSQYKLVVSIIEEVLAMYETVREYGHYPLS